MGACNSTPANATTRGAGCAATLDALETFDEDEARRAIQAAGLCPATLRSAELPGVPHVSRSGL